MGSSRWVSRHCVVSLFIFLSLAGGRLFAQNVCLPGNGACVKTWQQDTGVPEIANTSYAYRTGENLNETIITVEEFKSNSTFSFGQLFSLQLDGQVFAQPLVATGVTIGGTSYGQVVYVVTQNDTLYAIDGVKTDSTFCKPLNGVNGTNLLTGPLSGQQPVSCSNIGDFQCGTIAPIVGVLGTTTCKPSCCLLTTSSR